MKKITVLAFFLGICMLLTPLGVVAKDPPTEMADTLLDSVETSLEASGNTEEFKIYLSETKEVVSLSAKDYIFGVVAAEMPALYEEEALKAQAVAAYTYALYRKSVNSGEDYDITDDHTKDQAFITKSEAAEKWGSKADTYTEKIEKAVEEVAGYAITYGGEIIMAAYHAISAGKTENCCDIWSSDLPYLVSVESEWDTESENYQTSASFTLDEIKNTLTKKITPTDSADDYFCDIKRTDIGTVTSLSVCGTAFTGSEIRELFDLRSSNFTVAYKDDTFTFTVLGYGHGLGMSQNGANCMAKEGARYTEILKHYYTDCKIEKVN